MDAEFHDGDVVGAYQIEGVVGTGGMGLVYRARHALSERVVALKIQRVEQLQVSRARGRMMREATILAQLSHAGIPRFFECGLLDDGRPWIAMELVAGTSVAQRLAQRHFEPDEVAKLIASVAIVLASAHDCGVTHRDLKPDNIVLADDDAFPVRVLDWGIAHYQAGPRFTNHDEAIGTPTYMSPEQARGGPTAGHCDVYGLGVIAYHLLAGQPPFVNANAVEVLLMHLNRPVPALAPRCPDAPYGLVELVERMLLKSYAQRPTALEVHDALVVQHAHAATPEYHDYSVDDPTPSTERTTAPLRVRP